MSGYGVARKSRNPFDDDDYDDGNSFGSSSRGFGGGNSRNSSQGGYDGGGRGSSQNAYSRGGGDGGYGGSRDSNYSQGSGGGGGGGGGNRGRNQNPYSQGSGGGYDPHNEEAYPPTHNHQEEYARRVQVANHRMEDSSFSALRSLNEAYRMGVDTSEELERQAESLDHTERTLDEMHVDLDKGEKNLKKIKSPFGGFFSRSKPLKEVTDPKALRSKGHSSSSSSSKKPQKKAADNKVYESTSNDVVDRNLDELSKGLDQLMGLGELIGNQLDDSDAQIDRVKYKLDRNDVKVTKLSRNIKKEL